MKKPILTFLFIFCLAITNVAFAQGPENPSTPPRGAHQQERRENIEAMKIAFLTKKLNLTPEEAQVFWPVYNQYKDKLDDLRKKRKQDHKDARKNLEEMADKDVEQMVDAEIVFRQKELDLQKEYHSKFKAVLPIKKVAKLYEAEEQFKRVLLDKLKDKTAVKDN